MCALLSLNVKTEVHDIQYKPGGFLFSHLTQWRGIRVGSRDFSIFSTHRGGLLISA